MTHAFGILGGGNMGSAIARGMIRAQITPPRSIIVAEIDPSKSSALAETGCAITSDATIAARADTILLAVKPQAFEELARQIRSVLANPTDSAAGSKIVISIMAGWHSSKIRAALGENVRIVRAMPNVACQIGAGMTGVAPGDGARPGDEQTALAIFNALGRTALVDESLMHAVTAVSASGPAYAFLLAEAMEQAAVELGFEPAAARLAVAQTVLGAGRLLAESGQSAEALRRSVTSPRGTTEAALEIMSAGKLPVIIVKAIHAACERGAMLNQGQTPDQTRNQ